MNGFDLTILKYLNSFANLYPNLDVLITQLHRNNLLSNGVMVAVWWYCWFQAMPEPRQSVVREKLMAGLLASLAALLIAQLVAHLLPPRARPFSNPELHFVIPNWDGNPPPLKDWSAFPSDHAVLWFSLSATIYLASKPLGLFAMVYAFILSLFRVYSGHHNPTDILAGAAIGIVAVLISNLAVMRSSSGSWLQLSKSNSGMFYAAIFLLTYEISNTFIEAREVASIGLRGLRHYM